MVPGLSDKINVWSLVLYLLFAGRAPGSFARFEAMEEAAASLEEHGGLGAGALPASGPVSGGGDRHCVRPGRVPSQRFSQSKHRPSERQADRQANR